jgi:hypothetical protein
VAGPRWFALLTLMLVVVLLAMPTGDGSYSCKRPPGWLLVRPASQESAQFRADFFDDGYQCNRDAQHRGVEAGVVLLFGGLFVGAWSRRRRLRGRVLAV